MRKVNSSSHNQALALPTVGSSPDQVNHASHGKLWNFIFNQEKSWKKKNFPTNQKKLINFRVEYIIVSCNSGDFLHTTSHLHLSVKVTKFYRFALHFALCNRHDVQLHVSIKLNVCSAIKTQSPLERYLLKELMKS